jgi:hypothetical protein
MRAWMGLGLLLAAGPAAADESLLDSLGRSTGMVAPTPDMPDFVKASRPAKPPTWIPVFATPPEPTSKVKSAAELKAMDSDLEGAGAQANGTKGKVAAKTRAKPKP